MIELISGVTYRSGLMNDIEVEDAVSRGLVPKVSMVTARHKSHEQEERVQEYLRRHGIRAGITYQSMFVGWNSGTAVTEEVARKFGTPLVVQPALVTELVVACLGDLQNAVGSIAKGEDAGSELEGRIINLEAVEDRTAALRVLSERAQAHNKKRRANPVCVEARIYRRWTHDDFVRPCLPRDFRHGPAHRK
jgi:hypothetical protein